MSDARVWSRSWRGGVLVAMVLAAPAVLTRQAVTVSAAGGELRVQAPTVTFITGPVLDRLRDGRSVPIEIELAVLSRSGGPALARARAAFTLSFDLWEERIAVRSAGTPPRSVSHLRPGEAEAWCIRNVTVPLTELARLGRDPLPGLVADAAQPLEGVPPGVTRGAVLGRRARVRAGLRGGARLLGVLGRVHPARPEGQQAEGSGERHTARRTGRAARAGRAGLARAGAAVLAH